MAIVFIPSLEHLTMVKLITRSCERPEMFHFMYSNRNEIDLERFWDTDIEMTRLPNILKTRINCFLKSLRFEINIWRNMYREVLCTGVIENFVEFRWRQDGSINSLETAKAFVRNENRPSCCRFYLGCCHFLENDVLDLWERTPENERSSLLHSLSLLRISVVAAFFLPWIVSGASDEFLAHRFRPNNITDRYFFNILRQAKVSLRSLVERLPMDIRVDWLQRIARTSCLDADLVHFVASGSVRNQEIAVFRENALCALNNCLVWPLQVIFIDVVEHLWNYLSQTNFFRLLNNICSSIDEEDFEYLMLFKEVWSISPLPYKEYVRQRLRSTGNEFRNMQSAMDRWL